MRRATRGGGLDLAYCDALFMSGAYIDFRNYVGPMARRGGPQTAEPDGDGDVRDR